MSDRFDPYYEWLGIPPKDQPPNLYRLLGIELFESNRNVIDTAANRQMSFLKEYQAGEHSELTQRLLNELAAARLCLLNKEKKAAYDEERRASLKAKEAPARPPPLGHARKPEGPAEDTKATPEHDVTVPLRVPMTPPIALEPILPPTIDAQPPGLGAEAPVSPRTLISAESATAVIVEPVESGLPSRTIGMVLGIALGLACVAFAVLAALWGASLLSPSRSADRQTAEREDQPNPPAVEPALPDASKPSPAASVSDPEPSAPAEANPSQADRPAAQDPFASKPTGDTEPKESGAVPGSAPPEAEKLVPEREPAPAAAEPMPAASPVPAAHRPPAAPFPGESATPAAGCRDIGTGRTAAERRGGRGFDHGGATGKAQEALKLADQAMIDSRADVAKRLAVLALKLARKSKSADLVDDATMRMLELDQPITDALIEKAKQRLSRQ